jgi:hypothetical protein
VDTLTGTSKGLEKYNMALTLSPNPVSSYANLALYSPVTGYANISILSANGQLTQAISREEITRGDNLLKIDLQDTWPGLYILELRVEGLSDTWVQRTKFIKVLKK